MQDVGGCEGASLVSVKVVPWTVSYLERNCTVRASTSSRDARLPNQHTLIGLLDKYGLTYRRTHHSNRTNHNVPHLGIATPGPSQDLRLKRPKAGYTALLSFLRLGFSACLRLHPRHSENRFFNLGHYLLIVLNVAVVRVEAQ